MTASTGYGSIDIADVNRRLSNVERSPLVSANSSIKQQQQQQQQQQRVHISPRTCAFGAGFLLLLAAVYLATAPYDDPTSLQSVSLQEATLGRSIDDEITTDRWYRHQFLDHFSNDSQTWSQRYFERRRFWKGPGKNRPIFYVMGGEGEMDGLLYPFVHNHLAKQFNGYVLQAEHRFYDKSQPLGHKKTNADLVQYLTPEQAIADYLRLLQHIQNDLGCSPDRKSKKYCPVITVGASYPGFLSAMMRFLHPAVIDIGYASSAPLPLYAQNVDPNAYYNKITQIAERSSAGCAQAVKKTTNELVAALQVTNFKKVASKMRICVDKIPDYIDTNPIFIEAITFIIGFKFADFSMGNYPPTPDQNIARACRVFQTESWDLYGKLSRFFNIVLEDDGVERSHCFDIRTQIPDGPNATVMASDWTGAGGGNTGWMWDFQTGKDIVVQAGFSNESMFYPRPWSLEWLKNHTQSRFGIDPEPRRLVDKWGFDDLVGRGASRLLFTNGLNDGWSTSSIVEDLSPSIIAMNFPNGAHRSDIAHMEPGPHDTDDIQEGHRVIPIILQQWLDEVEKENRSWKSGANKHFLETRE